MTKETEKRLLRTLEILKEPHGSSIPTLVKAMNNEGPQVSLKRIVQTLRGCLENGVLKVANGKVKLKQVETHTELNKDKGKDNVLEQFGRPKSGCGKPNCPSNQKPNCPKPCPKPFSKPQSGKPGCAKPSNKSVCPKPDSKKGSSHGGREDRKYHREESGGGRKAKPRCKPRTKQKKSRRTKSKGKCGPRGRGKKMRRQKKSKQGKCHPKKPKCKRSSARKAMSRKRKAC